MTQPIDPLRVLAMSLLAYNTPESAGSATVDGTVKVLDVEQQTRVFHLAQLIADMARQGLCVVPAGSMQYMTQRMARLEAMHGAAAAVRGHLAVRAMVPLGPDGDHATASFRQDTEMAEALKNAADTVTPAWWRTTSAGRLAPMKSNDEGK